MKKIKKGLSLLLCALLGLSCLVMPASAAPANSAAEKLRFISVEASSTALPEMSADWLIDGEVGVAERTNFWSSAPVPEREPEEGECAYVDLRLEQKSKVSEVKIAPRAWNLCYPTGLTFYGSNDGKSWEVIKEYTGLPMLAQEGTTPITNKDPIIQTYTFDNPVEISYLRVMATAYTKDDSGSGFYFQMSEVEAYGEPLEQQVEQLTITDASGSNDWPGHTADVLYDGDLTEAFWASYPNPNPPLSESNPNYITLTLSKPTKTVSELVLYPRLGTASDGTTQPFHFPKDFEIQYLDEQEEWQTIDAYQNYQATVDPQKFSFDPVATKQLRIKITGVPAVDPEGSTDQYANLMEIKAYGTRSAGGDIPVEEEKGVSPMAILTGSERDSDTAVGNLVDTKLTNYYSSEVSASETPAQEEFVAFTYSKKYRVQKISLSPHFNDDIIPVAFPKDFKFQYKDAADGEWKDIPGAAYTGYQADSEIQKFTFDQPVDAYAVRVLATKLGQNEAKEYALELSGMTVIAESLPSDAKMKKKVAILSGEASSTVPHSDGSMTADHAVDGNKATFWSSAPWNHEGLEYPVTYTVTLKEQSQIDRIVLTQRSEGGVLVHFPKAFTLSYSNDGENWTDVASREGYKAVGEEQIFDLPQTITAKYLRLSVDEFGGTYCQLAEFTPYADLSTDGGEEKDFGEKYYFTNEADDSAYNEGVSNKPYGDRTVKVGSEGSMVIFGNVDFGDGDGRALSVKANYAGYHRNYGLLETEGVKALYDWGCWEDASLKIYLDNLESDPVAKFYIDYGDNRVDAVYKEMIAALSGEITGKHDVIVQFSDDASTFEWIQLTTEQAGPNEIEQRKAEYEKNIPDMSKIKDLQSDTWAGTDILGRVLSTNEGTESTVNEEKTVGMFFWNWNYGDNFMDGQDSPLYDVSKFQAGEGELGPIHSAQHWGESVYGHYSALDPWVIRRQGELLSDAGVDVIFFDCTNGTLTWRSAYLKLMETWNQLLQEGADMPKVSFVLPFSMGSDNVKSLENLYEQLYEPGLYKDCWYYLDGKPLVLNGVVSTTPEHLKDFFSSKPVIATYNNAAPAEGTDSLTWLELYPQNKYVDSQGRSYMSVGVSMNWNGDSMQIAPMNGDHIIGRSTTRNEDGTWNYGPKEATEVSLEGRNFQQQFDRAIEEDADFVFITGWNEWLAGRFEEWGGVKDAIVDQYDAEHSRDIEPSKGILKDAYYMQLVENIRRFKGQDPIPQEDTSRTVKVDGSFDDWAGAMEYLTYENDVEDRDCVGRGSNSYVNTSGRNDITRAKTAVDGKNVYFYVETASDITGLNEQSFMQLYINADRDGSTGWEGYDYILNRVSPTADTMTLERHTGEGYGWEKCAEVSYKISGNQMEIAVPKSVLGVENSRVNLEFKWMDNVISNDNPDIMDVYTEGDAAPGSRFNYVFKTTEDIAYPTVPDEGEGSGSSNESGKPESTPSTPQTPESGSSTGTDGTTSEESGNVQTGSMSTIGIIVAEVALVVISGVTLLMICRRRKRA